MSRRQFLQTTTLASAAVIGGALDASAAGVHWPIGCFNRPWMQAHGNKMKPVETPQPVNWGFDVALKGIKEAGYKTVGLLTPMPDEPFVRVAATPEYLANLKKRISKAGLVANFASLGARADLPLEEAIKDMRQQIDNGKTLGLEWLLTFGVDKPEQYETYYKMMSDAADYCAERKIKLVMKPHGGSSGSSEEIERCLEKVKRPNFKIWYDAGNIIYYTGKDPIEELKGIAQHVTGFCAKDCDKEKGNVMIQFGTGKVDFHAVYAELKKAGFKGPSFIECTAGKTYDEVTANAKANRVYLEKVFASL